MTLTDQQRQQLKKARIELCEAQAMVSNTVVPDFGAVDAYNKLGDCIEVVEKLLGIN